MATYWPALRGGFVWDDDAHVTKPELRSLQGLWRIWTEVGATQQYYPVLHSAFWVEYRLWGGSATAYHLLNVLLHAICAGLLVVVLRKLRAPGGPGLPIRAAGGTTVDGPFVAGLLFTVHPVCVESVAWVSEQKNTLSTVFYLLAGLLYLRWVGLIRGEKGVGTARRAVRVPAFTRAEDADGSASRPCLYGLATLCFILAVLTKSVTATLPAALLVALWWRQGGLSWRRDVVPLLPWFAVAIPLGLFTAWVERRYIGAQGADFALSFAQRILLSCRAFWFYLGKLAWPANLVFIYPRWNLEPREGWQWLFPAATAALFGGVVAIRRLNPEARGPLAAFLFFGGSLFPALGFFNVYPFLFSYVADHFQYLASVGVFALAGVAVERAGKLMRARLRVATTAAVALTALALGRESRALSAEYRDAETLYRSTLARNPGAWLADLNLGSVLLERGDASEAERRYRLAEKLEPGFPTTHFDLGMLLLKAGRPAEAAPEFEETVRLAPGDAEARDDLGITYAESGRTGAAEAQFRAAVRLQPEDATAHYDLAVALETEGRAGEAIKEYVEALRRRPDFPAARIALDRLQPSREGGGAR